MKARAIVLDIEGTTTSIRFVYDALFPYVRTHVAAYLEAHWGDDAIQRDIDALRVQAAADLAAGLGDAPQVPSEGSPQEIRRAALANITWQMDSDRKTTGLKSLQGKIWRDAYQSGELKGHIDVDVEGALRRWHAQGTPIYIYSSGSVAAQKLLFGHSQAGDLRPLLAGYFDTTTGPKKVASSYVAIAEAIGVAVEDIVFATDNIDEAIAARDAGVNAVLSIRPGNAALPSHTFRTIDSFEQLLN